MSGQELAHAVSIESDDPQVFPWYEGEGLGGIVVVWRRKRVCPEGTHRMTMVELGVAFCAPSEGRFDAERGVTIASGRLRRVDRGVFGRQAGGTSVGSPGLLVADLLDHIDGPGWWPAWWSRNRGTVRTLLGLGGDR